MYFNADLSAPAKRLLLAFCACDAVRMTLSADVCLNGRGRLVNGHQCAGGVTGSAACLLKHFARFIDGQRMDAWADGASAPGVALRNDIYYLGGGALFSGCGLHLLLTDNELFGVHSITWHWVSRGEKHAPLLSACAAA